MLDNWLIAATEPKMTNQSEIGRSIEVTHSNLEKSTSKICLVCDSSTFSKVSKNAFYALKNHFENLEIYDLGRLKNDNPEFIIGLFRELIPMNGRIIIISDQESYLDSAFRALEYGNTHISLALVNSKLNSLQDDRTSRSLQSPNLLNLSVVGYQRHFCTPDMLKYLYESFVHHLSYGQIRQNLEKVEPIIRNTNAVNLDTAALRTAKMPNGLDPIEICQIAKYAGMSSALKIFNISNSAGLDDETIGPLIGQIIWYFVEGHSLREHSPRATNSDYFQEHLVKTDYSNYSLTFWKSSKTNRWWFEIPDENGNRGNIYPCNKEDYDLACRNEISEYLINQINLDH